MVTKKKIQSNEEVNLQDLSAWSGENQVRRFKYVIPILKFNGNTGKFVLLVPDDTGQWVPEDIEKDIEIVILKVRRVLSSYEKQADGNGLRTFTNEHNSFNDSLTVFEMSKGDSKPRMIDAGSSKDIKEKFPDLRLKQQIYCLYDDKVVKLGVRGKSLSSLFNYYPKFEAQEHIFQFYTKLDTHEETNEGGLTYFVIDFEKGKESDLPYIAEKIKEVKESLELQDKQYASMRTEQENPEFTEKPGEDEKSDSVEETENKEKTEDKEELEEERVEDIPS